MNTTDDARLNTYLFAVFPPDYQRIPGCFQLRRRRRNEFNIASFYSLQYTEHGFCFEPDPGLTERIQGALDTACIKVNSEHCTRPL
jgi:hypothetical protein